LSQLLAGDLDTIALKALRKEPNRRYDSVEELSEDIRRHIEGLPVGARPDTLRYRVSRFARRKRDLVRAGAAVLILLAVGAMFSLHLVGAVVVSTILLAASTTLSLAMYRRAVSARRLAEERTDRAEWLAYTSSLTAAEGEIRANRTVEARRQLEKAPEHFRGWEWQHLWGRLNRSVSNIRKHKVRITAIEYSSDGAAVVTASLDGTVRLWNAETGEDRHVFEHSAPVESAAFSPDGRFVASASRDNTISLWNAETGARLGSVPTTAIPNMVDFHPDGRLAAGLRDGRLLIFEAASLTLINDWKAHEAGASCLAFSPDGLLLAAGFWDGVVKLWASDSWQAVRMIRAHRSRVTRLDWSPDGERLATASADTRAKVWDVKTGEELAGFYGFEGMVGAMLFDPSGERVLASDSDGKLLTFDTRTGELASTLRGSERPVYVAARHPDRSRVATATIAGSVFVWNWHDDDVRWLRPAATAEEMNWILDATPSPDGIRVATASRSSGADVWDIRNGKHLYHVNAPGPPGASCTTFSPDGKRLFVAHESGSVSVVDAESGEVTRAFDAHAASPREPNLDGTLTITGLDVHPDGSLLVTGSADSTVKIWDANSGRLLHHLRGHGDEVTKARFSANGTVVASSSVDSTIRIWNVASGRELGVLPGHKARIQDIAFSPDGKHLVSASNDGTVVLWDIASRSSLGTLLKEDVGMMAVGYTKDGKRLAAGGTVRTIWILDPASRREVVKLDGHVGRIKSVKFGPQDAFLVSASIDNTVGLWDLGQVTAETRSAVYSPVSSR
jgi:WD40 repeat protein